MRQTALRVNYRTYLVSIVVGLLLTQRVPHSYADDGRFLTINASRAVAISVDGSVVTGKDNDTPFLWTPAGGLELIPLPSNFNLFDVINLSGDGSTIVGGVRIGGFGFDGRFEGFRWTRSAGYVPLGRFSNDYTDWAFASGASHDGSVIVGVNDTPSGRRGFRWTASTGQIDLGLLPGAIPSQEIYAPYTEANDVSANGVTIVGSASRFGGASYTGFRWTPNQTFDVIGIPPAVPGAITWVGGAVKISGDANVIAGYSQGTASGAWAWTQPGGFSPLNTQVVDRSPVVTSISHAGAVIGGVETFWSPTANQIVSRAVIWTRTASGYKPIDVADMLTFNGIDQQGWRLTQITDVSGDGHTLIGVGIAPNGASRSWYAHVPALVPEPSSSLLAMMVAGGVLAYRRHRRTAP